MKLYIKRRKDGIEAVADYDAHQKRFVVLKGSRVSSTIAYSEKFRGAKSIEKFRAEFVEDGVVVRDAVFTSSSTAANFVTGRSTNGLTAWKDEGGTTLKALLYETEESHDKN